MSESSRKVLHERTKGRLDQKLGTHSDITLMRDQIRSNRGRLRFLFSMSGFVMVCLAMVLMPVAIAVSTMIMGDFHDYENSAGFLNAALGMCVVLVLIGIIFKLYAESIDLEIWFYGLAGSAPPTEATVRCRFLKLCTMAFIALAAVLLIWGLAAPSGLPPQNTLLINGRERHFIDLAQRSIAEKSHQLAVLSLLMAVLSQLYFNEVKRDELKAHGASD